MSDLRHFMTSLVKQSLSEPRSAARVIIELNLPKPVIWNIVLLTVIVSVILSYSTAILFDLDVSIIAIANTPAVLALMSMSQIVFLVFSMHWVGRAIGGTGELDQITALVAWLHILWVLAQVVQTVLMTVSPAISAYFLFASLVYGIWILIQFVSEAHGFPDWKKGAGVFVLSIFGVVAGISLMLSLIGVGPAEFDI